MAPSDAPVVAAELAAAEDASPVDAVETVTRELGLALDALTVSFLIADLGGRALVRLAHVPLGGACGDEVGRRRDDEVATIVPLDGGDPEQALRMQTVRVRPDGATWTVWAPVTGRGEAIGLLELTLPAEPGPRDLAEISRIAHLLGFVVIANRRHGSVRMGAALHAVQPVRGDPAPAAAGRVHLRGRGLHAAGVAGVGGAGRRGHLRLQPRPTRAGLQRHRRDGPRRRRR
ncbi:hypothetical protein ACFPIJ_38635 [Dactylosporangium cerinum]|uniref:GAF domain-containing protein n=1 Tax=Dactylosporangium cerinum TaxID=1434730 RepID=A0ABV9W743_9ACTN